MKIFFFFSGRQYKLQGRHKKNKQKTKKKTGSVGLAETDILFFSPYPKNLTPFTFVLTVP